jgi:hypothetical protein
LFVFPKYHNPVINYLVVFSFRSVFLFYFPSSFKKPMQRWFVNFGSRRNPRFSPFSLRRCNWCLRRFHHSNTYLTPLSPSSISTELSFSDQKVYNPISFSIPFSINSILCYRKNWTLLHFLCLIWKIRTWLDHEFV